MFNPHEFWYIIWKSCRYFPQCLGASTCLRIPSYHNCQCWNTGYCTFRVAAYYIICVMFFRNSKNVLRLHRNDHWGLFLKTWTYEDIFILATIQSNFFFFLLNGEKINWAIIRQCLLLLQDWLYCSKLHSPSGNHFLLWLQWNKNLLEWSGCSVLSLSKVLAKDNHGVLNKQCGARAPGFPQRCRFWGRWKLWERKWARWLLMIKRDGQNLCMPAQIEFLRA